MEGEEEMFVVTKKQKTDPAKKPEEEEVEEYYTVTPEMVKERHESKNKITYSECSGPQKLCMEFSKKNQHLPIFAIDYFSKLKPKDPTKKKTGTKKYTAQSYQSIVKTTAENWNKKNKSHFYEIVLPYLPCHIFIDLDANKTIEQNDEKKMRNLHEDFMDLFTEYLIEKDYAKNKSEITFYITDSSNEKKFSKHYVIRIKDKVFYNAFHIGSLVRQFRNWAILRDNATKDFSKCRFFVKEFQDKTRKQGLVDACALDLAIYTYARVFRIFYSEKLTDGRPFLPSRYVPGQKESPVVDHMTFLNSTAPYNFFVQYDILKPTILECHTIWGTKPFSTNKKTYELITEQPQCFTKMSVPRTKYMKQDFPFEDIWKKYGSKNREFMKVVTPRTQRKTVGLYHVRNFYDSLSSFKKDITSSDNIVGLHIGGKFSSPDNNSILKVKEFVCDYDIPDWVDEDKNPLRMCGCEKSLCIECSKIMILTYHIISFILSPKILNIPNNEIYFSGSKGLHFWLDPHNKELKKIVNPEHRARFAQLFNYQSWYAEQMVKDEKIINALSLIRKSSVLKKPPLHDDDLSLIKLYWPPMDSKVFINPCGKKMIRCPHSIHTKTNRKVEIVRDPESYFEETFKGLN